MHISEQGHVWVKQPTGKRCIMTGILYLVIYWHKPTAMQTLSSGWTGPFVVTEKVSVVDYRIQMNPTRPSRVVQVDQLIIDPCHQDRANWVRDELPRHIEELVINVGTDPIESQMMKVGVSIACQTTDTDPIVVVNDNIAPTSIGRKSSRPKRKPSHFFLLSTDLG